MIGGERRPYTGSYGREDRRPAVGEVVAYGWAAWEVVHVDSAECTPDEVERLSDDWPRPDIAPPSWTTTFTLTTRSGYSYIAVTPPVAPSAAEFSAGDA